MKNKKSLKQFVRECVCNAIDEQLTSPIDKTVASSRRPQPQAQQNQQQKSTQTGQRQMNNDEIESMMAGLKNQLGAMDARKLQQAKDANNPHKQNISRIGDLVAELQGLLNGSIQEQNAVGAGGIVGMPAQAIDLEEGNEPVDLDQPTIQTYKQSVLDAVGDAPWFKGVGIGLDRKTGEKVVVVGIDLNAVEVDDILLYEISEASGVPARYIRIRGIGKIVPKIKALSTN